MKYLALLAAVVSLLCVATAVTVTAYSDANCATVAPAVYNVTNPLFFSIHDAFAYMLNNWSQSNIDIVIFAL